MVPRRQALQPRSLSAAIAGERVPSEARRRRGGGDGQGFARTVSACARFSPHLTRPPLRGSPRRAAAAGPGVAAAFDEAMSGGGIALVRGLPRDALSEGEFELLTWAIGLHAGVARPQGKASQYLSAVRNAGTDYRSATGRGYSSNAEL